MNVNKLRGRRVEKGYTQNDMAESIEKSVDSYAKKERGEIFFTPTEMLTIGMVCDKLMTFY